MKIYWGRAPVFVLAVVALYFQTAFAVEGEKISLPPMSRGRTAALMTALFYHDTVTGQEAKSMNGGVEGAVLTSASPRQALSAVERSKVMEFANSLIYEGGYYPQEIYQLLGYENATTARVARLTRRLDTQENRKLAAWEAVGRVGRSGMSGISDNWAMVPGAETNKDISSPGTLAYLPALAVVYAAYPVDGQEAAAQLAILKDEDLRAASVARAAFSLLARILVSQRHDKDLWLRDASADSKDADTDRDLRAVRVKDWRYLRDEECAIGRMERAIYLWYKGDNYEGIMRDGRDLLRSRESLAYLSALSAATYGMESLPHRMIVTGSEDERLLELVNDLHDLANSEAVLRVMPEN